MGSRDSLRQSKGGTNGVDDRKIDPTTFHTQCPKVSLEEMPEPKWGDPDIERYRMKLPSVPLNVLKIKPRWGEFDLEKYRMPCPTVKLRKVPQSPMRIDLKNNDSERFGERDDPTYTLQTSAVKGGMDFEDGNAEDDSSVFEDKEVVFDEQGINPAINKSSVTMSSAERRAVLAKTDREKEKSPSSLSSKIISETSSQQDRKVFSTDRIAVEGRRSKIKIASIFLANSGGNNGGMGIRPSLSSSSSFSGLGNAPSSSSVTSRNTNATADEDEGSFNGDFTSGRLGIAPSTPGTAISTPVAYGGGTIDSNSDVGVRVRIAASALAGFQTIDGEVKDNQKLKRKLERKLEMKNTKNNEQLVTKSVTGDGRIDPSFLSFLSNQSMVRKRVTTTHQSRCEFVTADIGNGGPNGKAQSQQSQQQLENIDNDSYHTSNTSEFDGGNDVEINRSTSTFLANVKLRRVVPPDRLLMEHKRSSLPPTSLTRR